jgi:hypothetical protein
VFREVKEWGYENSNESQWTYKEGKEDKEQQRD